MILNLKIQSCKEMKTLLNLFNKKKNFLKMNSIYFN